VGTTIRDEAVCIRHWDWSETSQTVSLFTREHGVVRGLAKGSKREKAPFSGGIELLTRGEVVAIVRSSGALATVTAWDLIDAYPGARRSLRAFYVGSYLLDLVHHAVTDADPHPGLFEQLLGALGHLAREPELALLRGQWGVLGETGYTPGLPEGDLEGGGLWFLPREGVCVRRGGDGRHHDGWRVRPETVALLGLLGRGGAPPPETDPATMERASRLLGSYIRHVLGQEIPSAVTVFGRDGLVA
jgi:DNA repair protein RecO